MDKKVMNKPLAITYFGYLTANWYNRAKNIIEFDYQITLLATQKINLLWHKKKSGYLEYLHTVWTVNGVDFST